MCLTRFHRGILCADCELTDSSEGLAGGRARMGTLVVTDRRRVGERLGVDVSEDFTRYLISFSSVMGLVIGGSGSGGCG